MTDLWGFRNVLVTGATGFLGGWLTQDLLERGARVIGLVRDWVPESRLVTDGFTSQITTVRGCVEDLATVERAINEFEVETVFHLAAQTIVGIANRNPLSTFESNIKGTWTVLEACRRCPTVEQIVVASSDKAYGFQEDLPYHEEMPLEGRYPYDVSKSCADLISQAYYHTYGLPVCITRCANFYGGGDLNFNRLIPGTILSVLRDEPPVIRSDGSYVRDYLYVLDGARACVLLAERMAAEGLGGETFNFSAGIRIRAHEMVERLLDRMGRTDLEPLVLDEAKAEIPEQYLAADKASQRLGWKPSFTLDQGLDRTIEWYRDFYGDTSTP